MTYKRKTRDYRVMAHVYIDNDTHGWQDFVVRARGIKGALKAVSNQFKTKYPKSYWIKEAQVSIDDINDNFKWSTIRKMP